MLAGILSSSTLKGEKIAEKRGLLGGDSLDSGLGVIVRQNFAKNFGFA